MTAPAVRVIRYRCGPIGRAVPLEQLVAAASGLASGESEDVVLAEECRLGRVCPIRRCGRCPLDRVAAE